MESYSSQRSATTDLKCWPKTTWRNRSSAHRSRWRRSSSSAVNGTCSALARMAAAKACDGFCEVYRERPGASPDSDRRLWPCDMESDFQESGGRCRLRLALLDDCHDPLRSRRSWRAARQAAAPGLDRRGLPAGNGRFAHRLLRLPATRLSGRRSVAGLSLGPQHGPAAFHLGGDHLPRRTAVEDRPARQPADPGGDRRVDEEAASESRERPAGPSATAW